MAENIEHIRHSLAHLLAAAVSDLYPYAQPTIGPATDTGFYYDFDFSASDKLTEADLEKIEAKMRELLPAWSTFEHKEVSADEARKYFKDNPYKLELIDDIAKAGEPITFYTSGTFTDLCRGGHVEDMQSVAPDSFKLDKIAGAYWRGDENNQMLTRIYGIAFPTNKELEGHIEQMDQAAERDHRKIGKELGLFTFSDLVGPGLPLFTPKGTAMRNAIIDRIYSIQKHYGYEEVTIPHITKPELYKTSGHWDKFGDELFKVHGKETEFVMKPMNCPHHTQIFASVPKSYKDLPIRYAESTTVYRDEQSGELIGLGRVRSITQDDGHVFCTPEQIGQEIQNIIEVIKEFYTALDLWKENNYRIFLSVRDPQTPEQYLGESENWDKAEVILKKLAEDNDIPFEVIEGEAAFYGPKLDFMFKDAIGRERQLATVQLDFVMPGRFGLEYTASDGSKQTPVMIHRAIAGSLERFLAIIIEHFAGAFPFWLAPIQIMIIPISDAQAKYAKNVDNELVRHGFRTELDASSDSLGRRISRTQKEKVPFYIVIGDNEVSNNTVTLESRDKGKIGVLNIGDVITRLTELL